MTHLDVRLNLDDNPVSPELGRATQIHRGTASVIGILPGGMNSGRSLIAILTPLPGGEVVVTETSLDAFASAARLILSSRIGENEGHSLPMRLDPNTHEDHGDPKVS